MCVCGQRFIFQLSVYFFYIFIFCEILFPIIFTLINSCCFKKTFWLNFFWSITSTPFISNCIFVVFVVVFLSLFLLFFSVLFCFCLFFCCFFFYLLIFLKSILLQFLLIMVSPLRMRYSKKKTKSKKQKQKQNKNKKNEFSSSTSYLSSSFTSSICDLSFFLFFFL